MMTKYIFIIVILTSTSMCNKNALTIDADEVYSIKEVTSSSLFETKCGETSEIENEMITIRGLFSTLHYTPEAYQLYLLDPNQKDRIETRYNKDLAETIETRVDKLQDNQPIQVTGKIIGYDQPKNFGCKRVHYLQIMNADDIIVK